MCAWWQQNQIINLEHIGNALFGNSPCLHSPQQMPTFFKYTLGNTYMLYVFDMAIDQGHILEQAGSDIENWL